MKLCKRTQRLVAVHAVYVRIAPIVTRLIVRGR
jgi:hypothetical protein